MDNFEDLPGAVSEFVYKDFSVEESEKKIKVQYHFFITGLSEFHPEGYFPKKKGRIFQPRIR